MSRMVFAVGMALAVLADSALAGGGLSTQERQGKKIYLRGISSAGKEITAFLGSPPMEVPGSLMACGNCHGYDGRGKPEGGITPSDITWDALTKPYGVTHAGGRKHPPYDDASIETAITKGLDPAGNHLHVAMPRYDLSKEDLGNLAAYLRRLGNDTDPGLKEASITLGTVVPSAGPLAETGRIVEAVLLAYFDDLNRQGGIYNRKIDLRVARSGKTPKEASTEVARLVDTEGVFALVGAFTAGVEDEVSSLLEEKEVPLVGPSTLYTPTGHPPNRHTFYVLSGQNEQSRGLVAFAASGLRLSDPRAAVVYPENALSTKTVAVIEDECRRRGWKSLTTFGYAQGRLDVVELVAKLKYGGVEVVFFLGTGADAADLAKAAEKKQWVPKILCPGSLAGKEIFQIPATFRDRVYLSFPTTPSDMTSEGLTQYRTFAERHRIAPNHLATQLAAYCAARIMEEGLKRAGRDVSREKLIVALEGLYEYATGLVPPLTYGPNRRIGAQGAHIMMLDTEKKELTAVGGWLETPGTINK